jgi:hypothetical protein
MSLEIDILGEMWMTCKEYINPKDKQAAADHVISVVADHSITEKELKEFGSVDSFLHRAVDEYLGEEGDEFEDDDGSDDY